MLPRIDSITIGGCYFLQGSLTFAVLWWTRGGGEDDLCDALACVIRTGRRRSDRLRESTPHGTYPVGASRPPDGAIAYADWQERRVCSRDVFVQRSCEEWGE